MTTSEPKEQFPPKKVMAIMAHPDDAEFGISGTVAKWVRMGSEVTYVLCTSGDKGSDDPRMTSAKLVKTREAEQQAAAKILGVKRVVFLRFKDAELLPFDLKLRHDIVAEMRRYKPNAVICQDPTTRYGFGGRYIQHPDHIAAGEATLAAVYPSVRDRLTFPDLLVQGLKPHKVTDIFLMGARDPDHFEDISDTIDIKVKALMAHRSQVGEGVAKFVKQNGENTGKEHKMKYAESFRWLKLDRPRITQTPAFTDGKGEGRNGGSQRASR